MTSRLFAFIAAAAFSLMGTARADDAPKLPGSALTVTAAVAKSDAIFEGQLASLGKQDTSADHQATGPEYPRAQITFNGIPLKGGVGSPLTASIYPNSMLHEETPKEGQAYVFFLKQNAPGLADYTVLKLLPGTKVNFKAVAQEVHKARAQERRSEVEKSGQ